MTKIRKKTKRIHSILLALILAFTFFPTTKAQASDYINVSAYEDCDFYGRSAPEPIVLQLDCDAISFCGLSEGEIDNVTCVIVDITNDGVYSKTFSFDTDGSVTTYESYFPEGRYKVYFVGDPDILKTNALVVFSKYI